MATEVSAFSNLQGLSEQEVLARRAEGQGNDVKLKTSRAYLEILRENLFTFFNLVLFSIGLLLWLLGSPTEAIVTSGIALLNVFIAVIQEIRAKRKLDRIALLTRPRATVIREGQEQAIDPSEIVLGDVLVVGPGDQVVVDGQVVGDGQMDVDESLLTGETDPIHRQAGDPVLSGSFCVTGHAAYEAQKVGERSFANRLTANARTFARKHTPLQREVNRFIRVLLAIVLFFGILLVIATFVTEQVSLLEAVRAASVIFGIAPSSMFLMIVVAYALGALRIVDKGALVQQANSVESLCHVTVLCLDKTGTLTANRLRLEAVQPLSGASGQASAELRRVLGCFARSASSSNLTNDAILAACAGEALPLREEVPFSSAHKWSALAFADAKMPGSYILGAPEILGPHLALPAGSPAEQVLRGYTEDWTSRGLRVLLLAQCASDTPLHDAVGEPQLPSNLVPLGLVSLSDELRPQARKTIEGFRQVGIEPKIISGDNPHTVAALARQAGLGSSHAPLNVTSGLDLAQMDEAQFAQTTAETTIFGRITPQQKEKLVQTLRGQGQYVAMIGDGVNDVLALKQANLGIAMQGGSQATRSVADIVLLNDSFAALPQAFAEGQRILNGMDDILRLYLVRILSLALLVVAITMLGAGFPFTPTQSALISLLVLSIPAFGLALWARPGPIHQGNLARRLMHFALPAVLLTTIAQLAVYVFFLVQTQGDYVYAQQALTQASIVLGLLLVIFVEPPTKVWSGGDELSRDWRPTLLAISLLFVFGLFMMVPFLRDLYGLAILDGLTDYLVIGIAALLWAAALRFAWRARLVDRYLDVDLGGATHTAPTDSA